MYQGNWKNISKKIIEEDKQIFYNLDKKSLTPYQKRMFIFNYLTDNIEYDYERVIDIFLSSLNINENPKELVNKVLVQYNITDKNLINLIHEKIINNNINRGRNPYKELENTIYNHKGICNSISQYYKLLLEYNDIYSVCVICDNMLPRNHEINLVYDEENDIYSFDDITTAIINKNKEICFDYDIDLAKKLNQGIRTVGYLTGNEEIFNTFGVILSTDVINYYVGKNDNSHLKYGLELNNNIQLPSNILSRKKIRGEQDENTYRYKKSR